MKILLLILTSGCVFAHEHREHAAHQHGAGKLSIAFEDNKGKIEFSIPSESIFGFEHEATTTADKNIQLEGLSRLEAKISEMIVFDTKLNCKIAKEKIIVAVEGAPVKNKLKQKTQHATHSDTVALFNVQCDKSPVETELTFNFQAQFSKIKDLDVQVIVDNVQKAIEAKQNNTKLFLK